MAEFQYQLPNTEPQSPLEGLSTEARAALSNTAIGPSPAERLLAGESKPATKEELLRDAEAQLQAFAKQIIRGDEAWVEVLREGYIAAAFRIEWDDEREEPAIWPVNKNTGERDETALLNIRNKNIAGALLLPRYLRIIHLDCKGNEITSLPELPAGLRMLSCSDNQLTQLPKLPESLRVLLCSQNKLAELPELPGDLGVLSCQTNNIAVLPTLPNSLRMIDAHDNPLTAESEARALAKAFQ